MTCGIIAGSDQTQEWLLPWWWEHYIQHNTHPVTFIDFGLSPEKKTWCRARGSVRALRIPDFAAERRIIAPSLMFAWENQFGKSFWPSRGAWFKKPLACLRTPYKRTIWIDLDCEVRGSIAPLFNLADHPSGVAMAKDSKWVYTQRPTFESFWVYNSGVVVFRKQSPLIEEWARESHRQNHLFRGDQELLSHLIFQKNIAIAEVPKIYNWSRCEEDAPHAIIYHWHGDIGRRIIKHQIWAREW
ncbi:MAG TPA: hypothetical protein VLE95_01340 [Chlamydiales bacterium]|nr:hypothetical protein [Chlamydiales bacterium]